MSRFSEEDWQLFCRKIPNWRKAYMASLSSLVHDIPEGQWAVKAYRHDQKLPNIGKINMTIETMPTIIMSLLDEKSITLNDLEDFSDDLQGIMKFYCA